MFARSTVKENPLTLKKLWLLLERSGAVCAFLLRNLGKAAEMGEKTLEKRQKWAKKTWKSGRK